MTLESWFVLTVAAAFLLLGIAGSPLAWVALHHRKTRLEHLMETRWNELTAELRRLEGRLAQAEEAGHNSKRKTRARRRLRTRSNGRALPNRPFRLELAAKRRDPRRAERGRAVHDRRPESGGAPDDRETLLRARSANVMPRSGHWPIKAPRPT